MLGHAANLRCHEAAVSPESVYLQYRIIAKTQYNVDTTLEGIDA